METSNFITKKDVDTREKEKKNGRLQGLLIPELCFGLREQENIREPKRPKTGCAKKRQRTPPPIEMAASFNAKPYHISPHHTTPYNTIPYNTVLYHTKPNQPTPNHNTPHSPPKSLKNKIVDTAEKSATPPHSLLQKGSVTLRYTEGYSAPPDQNFRSMFR